VYLQTITTIRRAGFFSSFQRGEKNLSGPKRTQADLCGPKRTDRLRFIGRVPSRPMPRTPSLLPIQLSKNPFLPFAQKSQIANQKFLGFLPPFVTNAKKATPIPPVFKFPPAPGNRNRDEASLARVAPTTFPLPHEICQLCFLSAW
jgi:hypothetical protein